MNEHKNVSFQLMQMMFIRNMVFFRLLQLRFGPQSGVTVKLQTLTEPISLNSKEIFSSKWSILRRPFRAININKIPGRNFAKRLETLMACLSVPAPPVEAESSLADAFSWAFLLDFINEIRMFFTRSLPPLFTLAKAEFSTQPEITLGNSDSLTTSSYKQYWRINCKQKYFESAPMIVFPNLNLLLKKWVAYATG